MTFEPRVRGRRFGRPTAKKRSAKEKRGERETSTYYQEREEVSPSQASSRILNALEHLGKQRFPLSPLSEHFTRWIKDVKAVLGDFETQISSAVDDKYRQDSRQSLSSIEEALANRTKAEMDSSVELSNIQQQLNAVETELSKFENDYRVRTREIKRKHEKSFDALRREINSLDKQRSRILNTEPGLLQRVFGMRESKLEKSSEALHSKKQALDASKEMLMRELEGFRIEFESRRKQIVEQQQALRHKLAEFRSNTLDDALEMRKSACQELGRAVTEAIDRLLKSENLEDTRRAAQLSSF